MSLILDALKFLDSQSKKTVIGKAEFIESLDQVMVTKPDGACALVPVAPSPRNHQVTSLESLVSAQKAMGDVDGLTSVWVNHDAVTALIDDENRRDRVTLPLCFSAHFGILKDLASGGGKAFDHKQLIKFLRVTMAGSRLDDFVTAFRTLSFAINTTAGGRVKHGDESMGRAIEATVAESAGLPEVMVATVKVFDLVDHPELFDVHVFVHIDTQQQRIELSCGQDEITDVIGRAVASIRDRLRSEFSGDEVAVFMGSP